jgi:threonine/homoserine/homoserine lactone efflux protein
MDGLVNLPLFFITSIIIIIAPGPDFIYVTTRGVSQGKRAGTLSALGISVGLLLHTLLAAFGLSAIIQASRAAYLALKYIGAGYLLYLGMRTLISKNQLLQTNEIPGQTKGVFRQGILTNVFNPKAIITFMAFLPQFVDAHKTHTIGPFLFLGVTFALIAVIWFGFVGYFAGIVGTWIKRNRLFQNGIKYISGSILMLLGLRLAIKEE